LKTSVAISLLVFATNLNAADWQYAGTNDAIAEDEAASCSFINVDSVQHPAKNLVRFWVKSITTTHLTQYYAQNEKLIAQKAATRIARKYSPRFLMLDPIKEKVTAPEMLANVSIELIHRELIANQPDARSSTKTFFEIDCKNKQLKIIDFITFDENGHQEPKAADRGDEYEAIPVGSNGELLALMACAMPAKLH
jgi:hypothetical protein